MFGSLFASDLVHSSSFVFVFFYFPLYCLLLGAFPKLSTMQSILFTVTCGDQISSSCSEQKHIFWMYADMESGCRVAEIDHSRLKRKKYIFFLI